jgi:hypothetical protein
MQLHIHPEFALSLNGSAGLGGSCNASGRLINDDGLTLDTDTKQNRYHFNFSSDCQKMHNAANITLNITTVKQSDNVIESINDELDQIVIYNANSSEFQMYDEYEVTVYFKNDLQPVKSGNTSKYNARTNQQIWNCDEGYVMPDIDAIKFTPKEQPS